MTGNRIDPFSLPISPITPPKKEQGQVGKPESTVGTFDGILQKELQSGKEIKFSAHAQKRLSERNIPVDQVFLQKVSEALSKAETKGARDSLLLLGDLALVASIKNKTIVTAVDGDSMKDHVFTNIDSAVVIK